MTSHYTLNLKFRKSNIVLTLSKDGNEKSWKLKTVFEYLKY